MAKDSLSNMSANMELNAKTDKMENVLVFTWTTQIMMKVHNVAASEVAEAAVTVTHVDVDAVAVDEAVVEAVFRVGITMIRTLTVKMTKMMAAWSSPLIQLTHRLFLDISNLNLMIILTHYHKNQETRVQKVVGKK